MYVFLSLHAVALPVTLKGSGATQSSFRVQLTVSHLSTDAKEGRIVVPEVWSVPKLNVAVPRVNNRMIHSWKHLQGLDLRQYSGVQVELLLAPISWKLWCNERPEWGAQVSRWQ